MSPHTILSNHAITSSIQSLPSTKGFPEGRLSTEKSNSSLSDLESYIEKLQNTCREESSAGLLSPTEPQPSLSTVIMEDVRTMKGFIDSAVFSSNIVTPANRSANRFEVMRSGDRVAVIMLARPAYRLGETIPVVIDLRSATIRCHSLHSTLESSESIDASMALRSKTSIHRITKRVHASQTDPTFAANRVIFNPIIPLTSTPGFITSAISLEWRLRFEFITSQTDGEIGIGETLESMEEVVLDERGSIRVAIQEFTCETFDVAVPLKVYGATPDFDGTMTPEEIPI